MLKILPNRIGLFWLLAVAGFTAFLAPVRAMAQFPTITSQPASQTVTVGTDVTFSVTATTPSGQLRYQWKKNGFDMAGQVGSTLTLNSVTINDAGDYGVAVSNDMGTTTSATGRLTVNPPQTPVITSQPASQTVSAGSDAVFRVSATGSATLNYQWKKNGFDIPGATSSTLTIGAATSADAGNYYVVVTNTAGSVTSTTVTLTVTPAQAPIITTQPASQNVTAGSQVTFSVQATGSGTLQYQWRKNGSNLPSQTSSTLTIAAASSADAGNYSVVVSNASGSATSQTATLSVTAAAGPTITAQPVSQTVSVGSTVTFTVSASGSGPISYQWRKNGVALGVQSGNILTINSVATTDAGDYSVLVSNSIGSVISAAATLTVTTSSLQPPLITQQPSTQTAALGTRVVFSVGVSGSSPFRFQWKKDGVALGGQIDSTLTISSVTAADAGDYSVVVANDAGNASSTVAKLTVGGAGAPNITAQPQNQSAAVGQTVVFTVTVQGSGPFNYQWRWNGTNLAGATQSSLILANVQPGDAGNYSVVILNSTGGSVSSDAILTVGSPPSRLSVLRSGTGLQISFPTQAGKTYALETSIMITGGNWTTAELISGDGSVKSVNDPVFGDPARFYRLREQ